MSGPKDTPMDTPAARDLAGELIKALADRVTSGASMSEDANKADEKRCPRCGGRVRLERVPGSATDPNDPLPSDRHYWCSPCGKLWHPVEMPRPGGKVRFTS